MPADARFERLLEVDPELGRFLTSDHYARAGEAILPAASLEAGACDVGALGRLSHVSGRLLGLTVLSGVLVMGTEIQDERCERLLLPGSTFLLDGLGDNSLDLPVSLAARTPARILLLDDRFLRACALWPQLWAGLSVRLAEQDQRSLRAQTISQLPRVEDRLLALFWDLADQSGEVRVDGVLVKLAVTHRALGQMIGARRSTISLGLRALQNEGALRVTPSGWLLTHRSVDRFLPAVPRPVRAEAASRPITVLLLSERALISERATGPHIQHVVDDDAASEILRGARPDVVVVAADGSDPDAGKALVSLLRRIDPDRKTPLILVQPRIGSSDPLLIEAADIVLGADAVELEVLAEVQSLLPRLSPHVDAADRTAWDRVDRL